MLPIWHVYLVMEYLLIVVLVTYRHRKSPNTKHLKFFEIVILCSMETILFLLLLSGVKMEDVRYINIWIISKPVPTLLLVFIFIICIKRLLGDKEDVEKGYCLKRKRTERISALIVLTMSYLVGENLIFCLFIFGELEHIFRYSGVLDLDHLFFKEAF